MTDAQSSVLYHDWNNRLGKEFVKEAEKSLAEAVKRLPTLDALIEENQKDRDGYSFSVRRFGDFLSFEIGRKQYNDFHYNDLHSEVQEAFSICVKQNTVITLKKGLLAGINKTWVEGYYNAIVGCPNGKIAWCQISAPYRTQVYTCDPAPDYMTRYASNSIRSREQFPAYATDDKVHIGSCVLHIPQGLGDMVYRRILECAGGSAPKETTA